MKAPGTLYLAEPKRTVRSGSTVRLSMGPVAGRREGSGRSSVRSVASRSVGDRADLAVDSAVDLAAPGQRGRVRDSDVSEGPEAHEQVGLGIAHEVLDEALGLGVSGLAEVGGEAVVGREGDVARGGHDDVGHDTALQAAHAVGEDDGGHAAERLEALGEQAQRRGLVLPLREAHEAHPAPGQDGTEDMPGSLLAPVDDEVLPGHRLPGSIDATVAAVLGLGRGHRPAEAAGRARVALGPQHGQEALGTDAAVALAHPRGDALTVRIGEPAPGWPFPGWPAAPLDDPAHGLVGRAAEGRGGPVAAQLVVRGEDVQPLPRCLHNGCPSGSHGVS